MTIYKKTSPKTGIVSWYTTFYYTDWAGNHRQKKKEGFKKQADAKNYEHDFLERIAGTPDMTFKALADLYLQDYKEHYRPTSYENRKFSLDSYVLPYFKDLPINAITPGSVRKWQTVCMSNTNYAPSSLRTMHVTLSAVLNFAVKYYGLSNNPARIAGTMGKEKTRPLEFWTLEEFKRFQKTIKDNLLYSTIYTILFYTGIRKGELLALTLSDFDTVAGTLTISKSYRRLHGQDLIQAPKTEKGNRTIAIPPFLLDIVNYYAAHIYGLTPHQRLFEHTSAPSLKYNLDKYADIAGLKRIRVHDLRHSHASLLIEQGFSPLIIKERLGHEDIQTTLNTYSHLYPSKQEEIAGRLQRLATN
jgi:integrase